MAKMSALQVLNAVLDRIGETEVAALTTLSTIQQQAFDNINRALEEIAQDSDLKPLETAGQITLVTGTSTYSKPSDFRSLAVQSMRSQEAYDAVSVVTADEFNLQFPQGIDSNRTGYPSLVADIFDTFQFDRQPTANENGKIIYYRYFKIPTLYSTSSSNGTSYIPEGYDRTLLADYATWLTMEYMGHPEVSDLYMRVFGSGDNKKPEGHLSKFKRKFIQPQVKPRMTFVF